MSRFDRSYSDPGLGIYPADQNPPRRACPASEVQPEQPERQIQKKRGAQQQGHPRRIAVACDGSRSTAEAMAWTLSDVVQEGDTLVL
eukprot:CAMPEP_0173441618 /NCGR_PEP_ID=MMETSP1357-20121228/24056_1 /TAXON_ID=77926 /ORGANISM="Hemiselmis rufescens, Strain PCC563" /LENGTH=86 /DNA_ID=CAMNT_0014407209 /DNA_START=39 /DNA_END=296 /DNA_ORIENTATION=+